MSGTSHEHCHLNSRGEHFRFYMCGLHGDRISLSRDHCCIHNSTDVSCLWHIVSEQINQPTDYVELVIGHQIYRYCEIWRMRDRTLLQDLRCDLVQREILEPDADLPVTVMLLPPPNEFSTYCICDFSGPECCILGRATCAHTDATYHVGCTSCGNNACCRMRQCEHSCCRENKRSTRVPPAWYKKCIV